jgi:superfamily II DNA or RNA helicase
MELRPYQAQCVETTLAKFRERRKLLNVLPTGSGKTIIFSHLAKELQPVKTLILAHREELLAQAQSKLYKATGLVAEIEKAENTAGLQAPVVIGSSAWAPPGWKPS